MILIVPQIKLFKFRDGLYYSLREIFDKNRNLILNENKILTIEVLQKIDFNISFLNISKNEGLYKFYKESITHTELFRRIAAKTKPFAQIDSDENRLYPKNK